MRHPGWLTWRMSHILICLIVSSWFHLTCGTCMLSSLSSSHVHGRLSCHLMVCLLVVSDGAPGGSYGWPYNYEGFSEHLLCGRKITGWLGKMMGPVALQTTWEGDPQGQEDREAWSRSWLRREKQVQEGEAWGKHVGKGVRHEGWKVQLGCGEWEWWARWESSRCHWVNTITLMLCRCHLLPF